MKLKILNGILIIDILSIFLILSIIFIPLTIARVILGLPILLLFPGYTLVAALFTKKEAMNFFELTALSFGMSIAVVSLIGFGLNYTIWGIRLESVLYSITAFIFLTSAIALFRRARIKNTRLFSKEFTLSLLSCKGSRFEKSLSIILVIAIVGALGVFGYSIVSPKVGEKFTEFYILGLDGKAEDYPTDYILNYGQVSKVTYSTGTVDKSSGMGIVTLGIVNHEQQQVDYFIRMTLDGKSLSIAHDGTRGDVLGPVELQQGEKWEDQIGIVPTKVGDKQKLELLLFEDDETTSKYTLHLWIDVK